MINCAESNCVFEGQRVVIQLGKNVLENESKIAFFNYLESLKNDKGIIPVLLDDKGMLLNNDLELSDPNHKEAYLFKKYRELGDDVSDYIKKILFIEKEYTILDLKGNHIEFISSMVLDDIISGEHNEIKVKQGSDLFNNLVQIKTLLENGFSKISYTGLDELQNEIEGFGSGTMFVDLDKANFRKLESIEIFNMIHDKQVEDNKWKKKNKKEIDKIINEGYQIYQINGTILGGYSLADNYSIEIEGTKIEGTYLGNVFTTKTGGGVGKRMINNVKSNQGIVFCHTNARGFFENVKFIKIPGKKTKSGADLYVYINENYADKTEINKLEKLFERLSN